MIMQWRKNSWLNVVDARKPIITVINAHVCMAAIFKLHHTQKDFNFHGLHVVFVPTRSLQVYDYDYVYVYDYDHYVANGNQALSNHDLWR